MNNLKRYLIYHDLITYFATLIFKKKVIYILYLGTEGVPLKSNIYAHATNIFAWRKKNQNRL